MKTLIFKGYSDDTFGEYGVTEEDYDNCASHKPISFEVTANGISIIVTGQYSRHKNGCWDIGVSLKEEIEDKSESVTSFPMRMGFEGYTSVLEIDVPDDFVLKHISTKENERGI